MWYKFFGIWITWGMRIFFGKWRHHGLEKIDYKKPIIFAANHQNGFLDPVGLVQPMFFKYELGFFVRQDVFNNKIVAPFLRSLMLFPAYRIRDGRKNLSKNAGSFEYAFQRFRRDRGIIIFPEGGHAVERKLRPLSKGIFRMSFEAKARFEESLHLQVVTVGLNYTDPHNFGSDFFMNYGEPIDVQPFYELYLNNEAKAHEAFKKVLKERMEELMIHISKDDFYNEIEFLHVAYVNHKLGRKAEAHLRFSLQKKAIAAIEDHIVETAQSLKSDVQAVKAWRDKHDIRDWMLDVDCFKNSHVFGNVILLTLMSPFFLLGYMLNAWPWLAGRNVATKKMKDKGLLSSVNFCLSWVLVSFWYYALTIVLCFVLPEWWMGLLTIPIGGLLGFITLFWLRLKNKTAKMMSYNSLLKTDKDIKNIKALRSKLLLEIDGAIK